MARMIGNSRDVGCLGGKHCTCNGYYRTKRMTRLTKRSERQAWKKEILTD